MHGVPTRKVDDLVVALAAVLRLGPAASVRVVWERT